MAIEKREVNGVEVDFDTKLGVAVGYVPDQPEVQAESPEPVADGPESDEQPEPKTKSTAKGKKDS